MMCVNNVEWPWYIAVILKVNIRAYYGRQLMVSVKEVRSNATKPGRYMTNAKIKVY